MVSPVQNITPVALVPDGSSSPAGSAVQSLWGADGFSFKDLFDVINPLQQLPIVGSIYRAITGDTISVGSRLLGGGLLGGPAGFAAAGVNAAVEVGTGSDLAGHLLSAFENAEHYPSGNAGAETASRKASGHYEAAQKLIPS